MAYSISDLRDISATSAAKLRDLGVTTTDQLLERAGAAGARTQLADQLDESASRLLIWVNEADLMRVPGIAEGFSQLLEASGVDTVKELATRNAETLTAKIAEVNSQLNLSGRMPTQEQVAGWIEAAKGLVPKVSH
jgi:predicted flap endonuclease-1-like 5' DNA nuclease